MALTPYETPTNIIATLGVNPEDRPDLDDDTFRAKFDENSVNLAAALNLLITELASVASGKGASQIGLQDSAGRFAATQVEAALAEIAGSGRTSETVKGLADLISTHVADNTAHGLNFHAGRAQFSLSVAQSAANGSYTNIALDTVDKAFAGIATISSNKAVIQKAGTYAVEVYLNFAANNNGSRFVEVTSNAKTIDIGTTRSTATGFGYRELFTFISDFAVNEQLTLRVYQNSGGALDVTAARLKIKYIGGA